MVAAVAAAEAASAGATAAARAVSAQSRKTMETLFDLWGLLRKFQSSLTFVNVRRFRYTGVVKVAFKPIEPHRACLGSIAVACGDSNVTDF